MHYNDKKPIQYEDIRNTPAQALLDLSHSEIDVLIKEAERAAYRSETIVHWLKGIKVEKTFREHDDLNEGGAL